MPKQKRKKIDVATMIYDLDASLHQTLLGRPGDPEKHLGKLLRAVSQEQRADEEHIATRAQARDLFRQVLDEGPSDEAILNLAPIFEDGIVFNSMKLILRRTDRALPVAIRAAFDAAKLDPESPSDWYVLLSRFSWAHFGPKGKPGAHRKWSDEQYAAFLRAFHRAKTEIKSDTEKDVLAHLVERRIYNLSLDRMKAVLREARDPDFNRALVQPVYAALETESIRRNWDIPPAELDDLRNKFARDEADKIGARPI